MRSMVAIAITCALAPFSLAGCGAANARGPSRAADAALGLAGGLEDPRAPRDSFAGYTLGWSFAEVSRTCRERGGALLWESDVLARCTGPSTVLLGMDGGRLGRLSIITVAYFPESDADAVHATNEIGDVLTACFGEGASTTLASSECRAEIADGDLTCIARAEARWAREWSVPGGRFTQTVASAHDGPAGYVMLVIFDRPPLASVPGAMSSLR